MYFQKQVLDSMHRCYAVAAAPIDGRMKILAASEAIGGSFRAYDPLEPSRREIIWEDGGGTMSIVPVPGKENTFYAVRGFYPGFDAAGSELVCCRKERDQWITTPVLKLPYLHRFDLFPVEDAVVFLGATLCSSRQSKEDWSDPGKIYFGVLQEDPELPFPLETLAEGLLKNHGYWRGTHQGKNAGFIASENGVFRFIPGKTLNLCRWERIWNQPASEIALFDLDGCGTMEMAVIAPFHGSHVGIYKETDEGYRLEYTYPEPVEFAHALWAGLLDGEPAVLCGIRRMNRELVGIFHRRGSYEYETIDTGNGSANVCVFPNGSGAGILSANNSLHQLALYTASHK